VAIIISLIVARILFALLPVAQGGLALGFLILSPPTITWILSYYLTKSQKKAWISTGFAALIVILVLIYFAITARMPTRL